MKRLTRLEKIARLLEYQLQREKIVYANLLDQHQSLLNQQEQMRQYRTDYAHEILQSAQRGINSARYALTQRFCLKLDELHEEQIQRLEIFRQKVMQQEARVHRRQAKFDALEEWIDKEKKRFRLRRSKIEQNEGDELAQTKFNYYSSKS